MNNSYDYDQKKYLQLSYISQAFLIIIPIITFIIGFFIADIDTLIVKFIENALILDDFKKLGIIIGVGLLIDLISMIIGIIIAIIAKVKYDGENDIILRIGQIIIFIMYLGFVCFLVTIIFGIIHMIIALIPFLIIMAIILFFAMNTY